MNQRESEDLRNWLDERLTSETKQPTDAELLEELQVADGMLELFAKAWPTIRDELSTKDQLQDDARVAPPPAALLGTNSPFPPSTNAENTRQLGRFRVHEELGSGRFGVVYRAKDTQLNREVAIKIARPEVARQEDLAKRFLREAEAAGSLDHPGIVPVFEANVVDGCMFYVMPLCRGGDLAEWLEQHGDHVEQRLAATLVADIADALAVGHASGIVHRDVKPANIMMVPADAAEAPGSSGATRSHGEFQPRLLDFGLSRSLELDAFDTRSSMIVGTPMYMSPEQALGSSTDVGPASDIFAIGAILYEMLVGHPPFAANNLPAIITHLRECKPTPPSEVRRDVDSQLETICLKCLRSYPEDRYASASELADDLRRYLNNRPIRAKRATLWNHVSWWARNPARIRDAGIAMIAVNLPIILSFPLVTFVDANGLVTSSDSLWAMVQSNWIAFATGVGVVCFGWRTIRNRKWALELGSLVAVLQWLYCLSVLLLGAPTLRYYDGYPAARYVGHLLIVMFFNFEVAMCAVGLYAKYRAKLTS